MQNIFIDLVPQTCWFSNVRSQVSKKDWDIIRNQTYMQANHKCEICLSQKNLEAHEIWEYNDTLKIQKLTAIKCVCKDCHTVYHLGFAAHIGKLQKALKHLAKVNNCSLHDAELYAIEVFHVWEQRSKYQWDLDISLLDSFNIKYKEANR